MVQTAVIRNTKADRTFKTLEAIKEWWRAGVTRMASEPLAAWKTDNPLHPNYRGVRIGSTVQPTYLDNDQEL